MVEEIKEIIRAVESIPGTRLTSLNKLNAMTGAYEEIRDLIFTGDEIERMRGGNDV